MVQVAVHHHLLVVLPRFQGKTGYQVLLALMDLMDREAMAAV